MCISNKEIINIIANKYKVPYEVAEAIYLEEYRSGNVDDFLLTLGVIEKIGGCCIHG